MKAKLILLLALLAVLVATTYFVFLNKDTSIEGESVPTTSSNDYDKPVTLEYLQTTPEWNPTTATTGIQRISPDELTILDKEKASKTAHFGANSEFFLEYLEPTLSSENCEEYNVAKTCVDEKFSSFSEIAIRAVHSNEIIHAYQTNEGYSYLISDVGFSGNEQIAIYKCNDGHSIAIQIRDWNDSDNLSLTTYCINPITGEITSQ